MKVVLLSTLSLFLLTGCDNFQLMQQNKNKLLNTLDQGNQGTPTIPVKNMPAIPDETKETPPAKNPPVVAPAPATSPTPAPAPAPAPEAAPAPVPAATTPTENPPVVMPIPAPPEKETPAVAATPTTPETPEKKAEDKKSTSTEKTAEKSADKPAAAKSEAAPIAEAAQTAYGANAVTLTEYINYQNTLSHFLTAEKKSAAGTRVFPEGTQAGDVKLSFSGTVQDFNISIMNKDKLTVEFKSLNIDLSGLYSSKSGDYRLNAVCIGAKCDLLFIQIVKADADKIVENYPTVLKLVNGKYEIATFKKPAEYATENNALKASGKTIKFVPQLQVAKNLNEHVGAYGDKIVTALQAEVAQSETLAYSDLVLGARHLRTESLKPRITRENGKLVLNAQLEYTGPKKPIVFKGEISADSVSAPILTGTEMSLQVKAIVKGQIFALNFVNVNFKSQIPNVTAGFQTLLCSLLEEENNQFTFCTPIEAKSVFNDENVIEGNMKQKVRAAK